MEKLWERERLNILMILGNCIFDPLKSPRFFIVLLKNVYPYKIKPKGLEELQLRIIRKIKWLQWNDDASKRFRKCYE